MAALGWLLSVGAAFAANIDFGDETPSGDSRYVAEWVAETGDAGGKPYAIVDKKAARLYVFDGAGRLVGATPALLGSARGDHSEPGVGQRTQAGTVAPHERTTPAGRFSSFPGRNLEGEQVVWVDYGAAFAIHRLRAGASRQHRQARLESASALDNRVSLGCVVVSVAFYEDVVQPLLGRSRAVVYVLPEDQSARDMFGAL